MLVKHCSVCHSTDRIQIETVTNVSPSRDHMFPVMFCRKCRDLLARGELDVRMNEKGDLYFVTKKKTK